MAMRSYWQLIFLGLLTASVGAFSAQVAAQTQNELRAVTERMQRLEAEINQLQRQVNRGDGRTTPSGAPVSVNAPPAAANDSGSRAQLGSLTDRMDELEGQLRQMIGRMEEMEHRIYGVSQRMDKLVQDVDFRLAQLERQSLSGTPSGSVGGNASASQTAAASSTPSSSSSSTERALPTSSAQPGVLGTLSTGPGGRTTATATPPPPPSSGNKAKLPAGTPQEQYNYATGLLHKGDYDGAEAALTEFVALNGKDPLASSAQYWLGESFTARKQYKEAAQAYLAGYQKFPKGSKAPDSLLKLGISLQNLKQKQEGCAVFKQLQKEFPNAEARIKQTVQREQQQAGCG